MKGEWLISRLALASMLFATGAQALAIEKPTNPGNPAHLDDAIPPPLNYKLYLPAVPAGTQPLPQLTTYVGHPQRIKDPTCEEWKLTDDKGNRVRTFSTSRHPKEEKILDEIATMNPPGSALVQLMYETCGNNIAYEIEGAHTAMHVMGVAFLPFALGSSHENDEKPGPGTYTGWLATQGENCELWELEDAPQGGQPIVGFNSRDGHVEHRILQRNVGKPVRVDLKEWECLGKPVLDVTSVEILPFNNALCNPILDVR